MHCFDVSILSITTNLLHLIYCEMYENTAAEKERQAHDFMVLL